VTDDAVPPSAVAAFLRANPGWLTENPELYRVLQPPLRLHGDQLADHMAAMLAQERAHARAMADQSDSVLAAGRATAGLAGRVQEAVLALIRAVDAAECIAAELPALLDIDAATVCVEGAALPAGTVLRLMGQREVIYRDAPTDTRLLHGAAAPLAQVDALVRLSDGALLALASRDAGRLHPGQGTRPLVFLGRAVAAALER
jgi:uncharacterized protein YigA (DUF484 family)